VLEIRLTQQWTAEMVTASWGEMPPDEPRKLAVPGSERL